MADAFPLAWPEGWPRTPAAERVDGQGQFKRRDTAKGYGSRPWTFAAARDALFAELERLATSGSVVVSSNFPLSRGVATEGRARPADQAVAIYFSRRGRAFAMACDRYTRAEENMRSLALSIDALRTLERHGGGVMVERAFQGFTALAAPKRPHEILGVPAGATEAEIRGAWRKLIGQAHPDQGGSDAASAELNAARDAMLRALKGGA
jgi:hypothetical protein